MADDMSTNEKVLPHYEIMLIILPNLGEDGTKKALDEVKHLITSHGGKISHEDIWGVQDFAYRIKKHDSGYYVVLNMNFPPDQVSELERALNINQQVLRYLITITPANYQLKTFVEYQAEIKTAKEEEERQNKEAKAKKEASMPAPRPRVIEKREIPKKEVVVEKKVVKEEVEKVEKVEEVVEKAPEKKVVKETSSKSKLEEVDEKLKNIINDPDISL